MVDAAGPGPHLQSLWHRAAKKNGILFVEEQLPRAFQSWGDSKASRQAQDPHRQNGRTTSRVWLPRVTKQVAFAGLSQSTVPLILITTPITGVEAENSWVPKTHSWWAKVIPPPSKTDFKGRALNLSLPSCKACPSVRQWSQKLAGVMESMGLRKHKRQEMLGMNFPNKLAKSTSVQSWWVQKTDRSYTICRSFPGSANSQSTLRGWTEAHQYTLKAAGEQQQHVQERTLSWFKWPLTWTGTRSHMEQGTAWLPERKTGALCINMKRLDTRF